MKLKGVGFFEAHIEKLLLGLMVTIAAGVVVMQFAFSPNEVTVRNETLQPARAFDPVKRRAEELDAQMSATRPNVSGGAIRAEDDGRLVLEGDRSAALAGLEDRVKAGVSPRSEIAALGSPSVVDEALLEGEADDIEYAVVTPPAPSRPAVASYAGTLDPSELTGNEALAAVVGPAQPFDIATVSVEVTYAGTELEEMFRAGGQGDLRALPFNWTRSVEALGLQLERQERHADGSWGTSTFINGLPGEETIVDVLQDEAAQGTLSRDQLAADARRAYEEAIDYRRPLSLRTIAGPQWKPPTVVHQELAARGGPDNQNEAQRRLSQIASERRQEESLQSRIDDASRGSEGGRRGPRSPGGDADQPDEGRRTQQLRRQLEQVQERIESLKADVVALGYDPDTGDPLEVAGFEDTTVDARLLEDDQARLWAHDATAEPGKAYRYRARLVINNPMYGREPVLIESQHAQAASPITLSEPSEWSDPVVVAPKTAFFLTNASEGRDGALGPSEPSASVEVYTFYYGYYRRSSVTLRPGDMVIAEADMPDDLRLPVLAMAEDDRDPALPPAGRDGGVIGTNPGRPGDGDQEEDEGEPVPTKVPATMPVYLVDVTSEPMQAEGLGGGTSRAVAYFSQVEGQGLMRRVATMDKQGVLFQMLSRSADEGRNQGQPRESLVQPREPQGRDEQADRGPAGPSGGGKGGGSGGGGG